MSTLIESDFKTLKEIIKESEQSFLGFKDSSSPDVLSFLQYQSDDPTFHIFGVYTDQELVGYITGWEKSSDTIVIGPMYIKEEYRGKGIGFETVENFILWVMPKSYKHIYTKTWGKNTGSRKIFERLNFKVIEKKANDRLNGDSTIIYQLTLK